MMHGRKGHGRLCGYTWLPTSRQSKTPRFRLPTTRDRGQLGRDLVRHKVGVTCLQWCSHALTHFVIVVAVWWSRTQSSKLCNEGKYRVAESLCKKEMRWLQLKYIENIEKGVEDDIGIFHDVIFMLFTLAEVWGLQSNHNDKGQKLICDIEKMLTKKLSRSLN